MSLYGVDAVPDRGVFPHDLGIGGDHREEAARLAGREAKNQRRSHHAPAPRHVEPDILSCWS